VSASGKAKTRHARGHYREVKVRRGFYGGLKRLAEERGLSVPGVDRGDVQKPYWPQYG
jgi:predicted DNA-binding ribbon-helix-helix protein